jgi:hypothetical protein
VGDASPIIGGGVVLLADLDGNTQSLIRGGISPTILAWYQIFCPSVLRALDRIRVLASLTDVSTLAARYQAATSKPSERRSAAS